MKQAFLAARIYDGTSGDYRTNVVLLVEDRHIAGLVPQDQVPADYGAVDLESLTLLPGLIDCHVHLVWNGSADPNALLLRESQEKTAVRALLSSDAIACISIEKWPVPCCPVARRSGNGCAYRGCPGR